MIQSILVGIDDTPGSRAALLWAADLAASLHARVLAVLVFEPLGHLEKVAPGTDLRLVREQLAADLDARLCRPLAERGVSFASRVVEGLPASALAEAARAEGADLIVVGARRRGLFGRVLLGSTSAKLPTLTSVPVTIVREEAESAGG